MLAVLFNEQILCG